MKNNYKIKSTLLLFLFLQCAPFLIKAQVITTFEQVYPIAANTYSIMQSGRDVIPTSDGGYLVAGMTTTKLALDSDIYIIKTNSVGDTLWTKTFGGPKADYVYSFIPTGDGNYFILGFTLSYGAGGYDTWLVKIDPNATILWSKTYGGTGTDVGHEIVPTSDGNFAISGESNNDAFLMKVDPSGNMLWTKTYGGSQYDNFHSGKQATDGGYILLGQTYSYGQGDGDIYIVKTNSTGDTLWTKTYGGVYHDEGSSVIANADGTFMFDSETSTSNSESGLDIFLIKTDAGGNTIWTKTYGGTDKDVTHMMQPTSDGGYIIAGISRSFGWINPQMWLVKIDVIGDTMWTRNYGSWYHDHCYAVRQTSDGGYVALGHQEDGSAASITHVFFLKLDVAGTLPVEKYVSNNTFSVYPNPTTGVVQIDLNNSVSASSTIKIYNSLGQTIFFETTDAITTGSKTFNLNDNGPGIYFVSIQSGKNITTKKIILE